MQTIPDASATWPPAPARAADALRSCRRFYERCFDVVERISHALSAGHDPQPAQDELDTLLARIDAELKAGARDERAAAGAGVDERHPEAELLKSTLLRLIERVSEVTAQAWRLHQQLRPPCSEPVRQARARLAYGALDT